MKKIAIVFAIALLAPLFAFSQNAKSDKVLDKKVDIQKISSDKKINVIADDTTQTSQTLKVTKVWPNPAISEVNISYEVKDNPAVSLEIFDLKGNIVVIPEAISYQFFDKKIVVKISNLTVGHYEFKIKTESDYTTGSFKVIK